MLWYIEKAKGWWRTERKKRIESSRGAITWLIRQNVVVIMIIQIKIIELSKYFCKYALQI